MQSCIAWLKHEVAARMCLICVSVRHVSRPSMHSFSFWLHLAHTVYTCTATPLSTSTTTPQQAVTPTRSSSCPSHKTRGTRSHSAITSGIVTGRLASTLHSTGYEPKDFEDKVYLDFDGLSDFSKTTEGSRFCVKTSLSNVSCGEEKSYSFVNGRTQARNAGFLTRVQGPIFRSRRNSAKCHSHNYRVTEHEFHSDDRNLRELLERRARQAFYGKNSAKSKKKSTEYDVEIKDWKEEIQNMH